MAFVEDAAMAGVLQGLILIPVLGQPGYCHPACRLLTWPLTGPTSYPSQMQSAPTVTSRTATQARSRGLRAVPGHRPLGPRAVPGQAGALRALRVPRRR